MELGVLTLGDHLPNPHDGRRLPQSDRLRSIVESGVRAEELGFSMIAIGEHHFNDYIVSSPQVLLAAIASRTERIRLATAVTLLPMADPVRVAEDFASLDLISQGRVELVVGRGISPEHYAAFGFDHDEAKPNLDEKLALLNRIWGDDEPLTWSGRYRGPLDGVVVQPRPYAGVPRIWTGTGMNEASVRRAAESGLPLMLPSIFMRAEKYRDMVALYREIMAANGNAGKALVGCCSHVHVGPTGERARAGWRPYLEQYVGWVNGLRGVTMDMDYERFVRGPAICGDPGEVADRLLSIHEALRPDVHLSVFDLGGLPHDELTETMELFAAEVMPKVRAGT